MTIRKLRFSLSLLVLAASALSPDVLAQQAPPEFGIASDNMTPIRDVLQGVASFTPEELGVFRSAYGNEYTAPEIQQAITRLVNDADMASGRTPVPALSITLPRDRVSFKDEANGDSVGQQATDTMTLALAYLITKKPYYRDMVRVYVLSWAQSNRPQADGDAMAKFIPLYGAYDLLRDQFTSYEQTLVDGWLTTTADMLIRDQDSARQQGLTRGVNHYRSGALLTILNIGCVTRQTKYIRYVTDPTGFIQQVGQNLATVPGEPEGLGFDYHQRKSVAIVADNLASLERVAILIDRLHHIPDNPYGITYDPFTSEVGGASLIKTLKTLIPYLNGAVTTNREFSLSQDEKDKLRIQNGLFSTAFYPINGIEALEQAYYFMPIVKDDRNNASYNLADLTYQIINNGSMKRPPSRLYPTPVFFIYSMISPHLHK